MAAPVEVGQLLAGKYRVERVLGEGGMGVVVAAFDTALERRVALKFLLPRYLDHVEASARFMREARAAVKIKSEHVARVIDVGKMEGGAPYIVMEFLEGADLAEELEARGSFPLAEAVGHILQACDAVAEAHACGIVHRDLKPANLFLAKQPDGTQKVKVLDFGISKDTLGLSTTDASLTCTSSLLGSPLYMSPEQMRSTRTCDSRTDVWALGIILYELLEGHLPFLADSLPELSAKILLDEPLPITRADVPPRIRTAIATALRKNPEERFATVGAFAQGLSRSAPKHLRETLKRISRVQMTAGLTSAPLQLPSVPPSSAMPAAVTYGGTVPPSGDAATLAPPSTQAVQSLTQSSWGQTSGPLSGTSSRRFRVPAIALVAGIALSAAWLVRGSMSSTVLPPTLATQPVENDPAPRTDAPVPAPPSSQEESRRTPEPLNTGEPSSDELSVPKVEPKGPESASPIATAAATPAPRVVKRPARLTKTTQKKPPTKPKRKYGGRK